MPKEKKKKSEPEPVVEEEPEHNDPLRPHGRPVTWTVSIKAAKNVPSAAAKAHEKSTAVVSCVKYEFPGAEKPLQTPAVKDGDRSPAFEYEETFTAKNTEEYLTQLVNFGSLTFTLADATKEKKPEAIGTFSVDLVPFLKGAIENGPVPSPEASSDDGSGDETPADGTDGWYRVKVADGLDHVTDVPEVQVSITLSEPLLTAEQVEESNVVSVSIDQVFNLPNRWLVPEDADLSKHIFRYVAGLKWPVHAEKTAALTAGQGTLALPPPPPEPVEGEEAVPVPEPDEEDPSTTEPQKQRVAFAGDNVHTYFMCPSAIEAMKSSMDNETPIIVDFARKVKDEKLVDHNYDRYHGQAELSFAPILAPGVDEMTVRLPITKYVAPEGEESATQESDGKKSPRDGKPGSAKGKKKPAKHPELEAETGDDVEESPYEAAQSYLVVTFRSHWGSITPRLPTPPPKTPIKPADLIPTRPPVPRHVNPTDSTEEFRRQIISIVHTLREEYSELFADGDIRHDDPDERRKKLVFELNESGKYYTFKEKLKLAVIKVAREAVHANQDPGQSESFHNDLYVHLVRNMHLAVNQFIHQHDLASAESFVPEPELVPTEEHDESRVRLATEAEWNQDYDRAAEHLKQRIVNHKHSPEKWFEYGAYCMRRHDVYKAEECFREGLALDPANLSSLLAYGSLLLSRNEFEHADVFIDEAVNLYDNSIEAATLQGLSADLQEKKDDAKDAFKRAQQLIDNPDIELANVLSESRNQFNPHVLEDSIYLQLVNFALAINLPSLVEALIERDIKMSGRSFRSHIYYAKLYLANGEFGKAQEHIDNAFVIDDKNAMVWGLQGHAHFASGELDLAQEMYETCIKPRDQVDSPDPSVFTRLGAIYLSQQRWEDAKDVFYKGCEAWPSSTTWKGVGEAYYRLNDTALAEDAFAEANVLDARNADVWAWLALVCIRSERIPEADKCYASARQTGLDNVVLLAELADAYHKRGRQNQAERAARAALELSSGHLPRAHIVLADILSASGREEEGLTHYNKALKSGEIFEGDRNHVHRRIQALQPNFTDASLAAAAR